MEELEAKHFKCIKRDNSEEEVERRWQIFKIVLDKFYDYLKTKGINDDAVSPRAVYISLSDVSDRTIRNDLINKEIFIFRKEGLSTGPKFKLISVKRR